MIYFILIYLIIALISYFVIIRKWEKPWYEKVGFSLIWILILPLYGIHWAYNNL